MNDNDLGITQNWPDSWKEPKAKVCSIMLEKPNSEEAIKHLDNCETCHDYFSKEKIL